MVSNAFFLNGFIKKLLSSSLKQFQILKGTFSLMGKIHLDEEHALKHSSINESVSQEETTPKLSYSFPQQSFSLFPSVSAVETRGCEMKLLIDRAEGHVSCTYVVLCV